jgi:hypothetical protein
MPPVLTDVVSCPPHCRLLLDPAAEVTVDVAAETVRAHFAAHKLDLVELCAQKRLAVYYQPIRMSLHEWAGISDLLLSHRLSRRLLSPHPALFGALRHSYNLVCAAPYRMFAGATVAASPGIYLAHPFDFYPKDGGHYCLLSDRSWLFKTWVQIARREVRMEEAHVLGHFVGET